MSGDYPIKTSHYYIQIKLLFLYPIKASLYYIQSKLLFTISNQNFSLLYPIKTSLYYIQSKRLFSISYQEFSLLYPIKTSLYYIQSKLTKCMTNVKSKLRSMLKYLEAVSQRRTDNAMAKRKIDKLKTNRAEYSCSRRLSSSCSANKPYDYFS